MSAVSLLTFNQKVTQVKIPSHFSVAYRDTMRKETMKTGGNGGLVHCFSMKLPGKTKAKPHNQHYHFAIVLKYFLVVALALTLTPRLRNMAEEEVLLLPLPQWMQNQNELNTIALQQPQRQEQLRQRNELILRQLTVAYALARLIHHAQQRSSDEDGGASTSAFDETLFRLDKFMVRTMPTPIARGPLELEGNGGGGAIFTTDIAGVNLVSNPPLQLIIRAPDFDLLNTFGDFQIGSGKNGSSLEVEIVAPTAAAQNEEAEDDMAGNSRSKELLSCHSFGICLQGIIRFPKKKKKALSTRKVTLKRPTNRLLVNLLSRTRRPSRTY